MISQISDWNECPGQQAPATRAAMRTPKLTPSALPPFVRHPRLDSLRLPSVSIRKRFIIHPDPQSQIPPFPHYSFPRFILLTITPLLSTPALLSAVAFSLSTNALPSLPSEARQSSPSACAHTHPLCHSSFTVHPDATASSLASRPFLPRPSHLPRATVKVLPPLSRLSQLSNVCTRPILAAPALSFALSHPSCLPPRFRHRS